MDRRIRKLAPWLIGGALIPLISSLAFEFRTRKEILARDQYTCQNPNCIGLFFEGYPRQFFADQRNGMFMLQASHYSDSHVPYPDTNKERGFAQCTCCHIRQELRRGNLYGAESLYENQTIRTYDWIDRYGFDEKPPFEVFLCAAEEDSWEPIRLWLQEQRVMVE